MLSNDAIAEFERVLTRRQGEVAEQLARLVESSAPVEPDVSIGRLTRNDAMQQQQMALHARRQLELQQTQIETALDRIASGKYGVCVLCHEAIDPRRLEIMPEAPLCMPCLRQRSKRQ